MVAASGRAAALVAILVLAGCVGDDAGDALEPEAGDVTADVGGNETAGTNLTFDGPVVDEVLWANGSAGMAASCPMACWSNVTDISAVVPHGVPVLVWAELRQENPQPSGSFMVELFIYPGQDARSYNSSYEVFGQERVVRWNLFARGQDSVEVEVFSTDPGTTEPGEYSLEIRVVSDPAFVPASVAAAFEAEPDATYELRPSGPGPMRAVVYGPDDAPVARLNGTEPATFAIERAGEHVVFAGGGSANVTVGAFNATRDAWLRPVGVPTAAGEIRPVAGPAPTSWTFETPAAPVLVRFVLVSALPVQGEPTQDHVVIESPAGVVLDEYVGCDTTCYVVGFTSDFVETTMGDPALVPGEYTVTVTPGGAEAAVAAESFAWLDRSR